VEVATFSIAIRTPLTAEMEETVLTVPTEQDLHPATDLPHRQHQAIISFLCPLLKMAHPETAVAEAAEAAVPHAEPVAPAAAEVQERPETAVTVAQAVQED
jgi:hypothetical protein